MDTDDLKITLKAARTNAGYTQEQAAEALGLSLSTLKNDEAGRTYPSVNVVKAIEELYQVRYDNIIF
mgnify:FL=1